jgi:hypothetical protein
MTFAAFVAQMIASVLPMLEEPAPVEQRIRITSMDDAKVIVVSKQILEEIREQFPNSLRQDIQMEINYDRNGKITTVRYFSDDPVVMFLELGTGIYGFRGREIKPYRAKALHFYNEELARKLGFKDGNVFLKKVKGIKGRFAITKGTQKLQSLLRNT